MWKWCEVDFLGLPDNSVRHTGVVNFAESTEVKNPCSVDTATSYIF